MGTITEVAQSELDLLQQNVSKVLGAECGSRDVHAYIDGDSSLEKRIWNRAGELGWLAVGLPEADGGLGYGVKGLDILHREFGKHLTPGPFITTLCAAQWLSEFGNNAQKSNYLPGLIAGEISAAVPAAIGPHTSAPTERSTVAMLGNPDAGLFVLPFTAADGCSSFALFGRDIVRPSQNALWDGTRKLCNVDGDVRRSATDVIRDPDGSASAGLSSLLALAIAGDSLGLAHKIFHQTIEYMKTRIQFDKPIGAFQALKHRAADLATMLVTRDHLAAQALDAAADNTPEAAMWALLAKAGATDAASHIAADCLQLHGGIGFTWEFDVHLFLKRARLNEMLIGTNYALRDRAAQELVAAARERRSTMELRS